jgi:hypothetical protein
MAQMMPRFYDDFFLSEVEFSEHGDLRVDEAVSQVRWLKGLGRAVSAAAMGLAASLTLQVCEVSASELRIQPYAIRSDVDQGELAEASTEGLAEEAFDQPQALQAFAKVLLASEQLETYDDLV